VFVNTDEAHGFTLTAEMLEPHLTERTRMVIIDSPSNPSGAVVEREEFEKIYRLTSARGIYLMTDECYCKFLYDSEPFSIAALPGAKETVLVAGSLSKTYAMTGWRIGFGLVPTPIVQAMTKLQSHSTSNPCSISQKAAVEALRGPQESVGIMLAEYANGAIRSGAAARHSGDVTGRVRYLCPWHSVSGIANTLHSPND
jgi:aspartate aminotransferase